MHVRRIRISDAAEPWRLMSQAGQFYPRFSFLPLFRAGWDVEWIGGAQFLVSCIIWYFFHLTAQRSKLSPLPDFPTEHTDTARAWVTSSIILIGYVELLRFSGRGSRDARSVGRR